MNIQQNNNDFDHEFSDDEVSEVDPLQLTTNLQTRKYFSHFVRLSLLKEIVEYENSLDEYESRESYDINNARRILGMNPLGFYDSFNLNKFFDFSQEHKFMLFFNNKEITNNKFSIALDYLLKKNKIIQLNTGNPLIFIGDNIQNIKSRVDEFIKLPTIIGENWTGDNLFLTNQIKDRLNSNGNDGFALNKSYLSKLMDIPYHHLSSQLNENKIVKSNKLRLKKKLSKKPYILRPLHSVFLEKYVKQNMGNKKITIKIMKEALKLEFPEISHHKLSNQTLSNFLRKFCKCSFKKISLTKVGNDFVENIMEKQKRMVVADYMINIFEYFEVIFLDECYFFSDYSKFYSWSLRNVANRFINNGTTFKFAIYAAISKKRFLGFQIQNLGTSKSSEFIEFLKNLIDQIFEGITAKKKNFLIFMDNSSVHRSNIVKEFFKQNNIKVVFNAPKTPSFNPIELLFNVWKQKVGKKIYEEEQEMMTEIFHQAECISQSEVIPKFVIKSLEEWKKYSDHFYSS